MIKAYAALQHIEHDADFIAVCNDIAIQLHMYMTCCTRGRLMRLFGYVRTLKS